MAVGRRAAALQIACLRGEDLRWGPVALGSTEVMRVPDSESGSKMGWPCRHGDTMIHFTYKTTDL